MKKIDTLVRDIYKTVEGKGSWDSVVGSAFGSNLSSVASQRFSSPQEPRGYLFFICGYIMQEKAMV